MDFTQLPVQINTLRLIKPRLKVYYPIVDGLPDQVKQKKINDAILAEVYGLLKAHGYYQNPQTTITGSYELKTNERGILSLSQINYAYMTGAAHGLTIIKSFTTDVLTAKIYRLKDLFKPGADYVARLSDIVALQIKERKIPLLNPFTQINPDQDYYIADKSLVLYFQLYELAAYVYGFLYFPISVYEIQDIIDEDGPLGKMLY